MMNRSVHDIGSVSIAGLTGRKCECGGRKTAGIAPGAEAAGVGVGVGDFWFGLKAGTLR